MAKKKPHKRIQSKLTDRVKKQIKDNKGKVKSSNYKGESLTYLKKYRSLAKARKIKKESQLTIEGIKIPKNSDLYKTIAASAALKKQSVAEFIKENKKAVEALIKNGKVFITRETDYVIKDIQGLPKSKVVFNFNEPIPRIDAIYALQQLLMASVSVSNIVLLMYEVGYDLRGNLYLEIPTPDKYEELLSDIEEMGDDTDSEQAKDEEWTNFLDRYKTITYIKS